jgi:ATP-binding cassette subfamily F protein 3
MLRISNLTYRVAGRPLLENAELSLAPGQHAGLVGRNGTGKTTLLRLLLGEISPDAGSIDIPSGWRIGTVAQETPEGPKSLVETVLDADRERAALLIEADTATDPHRIGEIHEELLRIGAHSAPARAARILAGLGFDDAAQQRPVGEFSGGWRMRVALAAVLFARPDLLLLDEPTNHLDLEAALWLEEWLRNFPGTLILVSHDRELLNRAVDRIVHLEMRRLTSYNGNYDTFESTRSQQLMQAGAAAAKADVQRKHMQAFVDRFRYKASKARQAQSRLKAIAKLNATAPVIETATTTLAFPDIEELSSPVMVIDEVTVGYDPANPVLRHVDLRIDADDRIAILGVNGNGKSTMMRLLAGRLQPFEGKLQRNTRLRIGYFAQHQTDELDRNATGLAHMQRAMPRANDERCRAQLARFGLGEEKAKTLVGKLSGGEKARLLFALMSAAAPHVLLLDEPTNHLDIDARRALVDAINLFAGAVLLVTHDPHLIRLTADRLWLADGGTCAPFEGDLDDYVTGLGRGNAGRKAGNGGDARAGAAADRDRRRQGADTRAAAAPVRRAAEAAERRFNNLLAEKQVIEARLADPKLYAGPPNDIVALQRRLKDTESAIAKAEAAWFRAQEELGQAQGS